MDPQKLAREPHKYSQIGFQTMYSRIHILFGNVQLLTLHENALEHFNGQQKILSDGHWPNGEIMMCNKGGGAKGGRSKECTKILLWSPLNLHSYILSFSCIFVCVMFIYVMMPLSLMNLCNVAKSNEQTSYKVL